MRLYILIRMMLGFYIAALLVLLAAVIDAVRIRLRWSATPNINHGISWSIGVVLAGTQWFIQHPDWHPALFILLCVSCRLLLYDPALNLFRRERLTYVSVKTNAVTATWWARLQVGFWGQRAIGAGGVGTCLILQFIIR